VKTSTSYKLRLIEQALKHKIAVRVEVRGARDFLAVTAMRNIQHTILLTLDRNGGFAAVDPDDIFEVWVPKLPPPFQE
jgi:hypothetical protein